MKSVLATIVAAILSLFGGITVRRKLLFPVLALVLLVPQAYAFAAPSVPSSGLLVHWQFDEGIASTTADTSGNGNTGTFNGLLAWATSTSAFGDSLSFATSSTSQFRYVSLPATSTVLSSFPTSGSLSFWVYDSFSTEKDFKVIFGGASESGNRFYIRNYSSSRMDFEFATTTNPTTSVFSYTTATLPDNTWVHFTLSWDSLNHVGYVYRNGVLVYSATIDSTWTPANQVFHAGTPNNSSFNGGIDEITLYNRVLSPSEVNYIYSLSTSTTPTPDTTPPSAPGGFSAWGISVSKIALNWATSTDSGSGVEGYLIYRDGTYVTNVSSTTDSYVDSGLVTSTAHSYAVYAFDYAGNRSSASNASATTNAAPNASWWASNAVTSTSTLAAPLIAAPYTCVTNYYVSTTGSDANSGTSTASAWQHIDHAVNAGINGPGVCVNVAPGDYHEHVFLSIAGNANSPTGYFVLRSQTPHGAKITLDATDTGPAPVWNTASYFIIDGFTITGTTTAISTPGISLRGPAYNWAINNVVHTVGFAGIESNHSDYFRIEGNIVYDTTGASVANVNQETSGIDIYQSKAFDTLPGFHGIIKDNIVFNNTERNALSSHSDGNGVIIDDLANSQNGSLDGLFPNKTLIENNLVFNNGGGGIHIFLSDHVTVRNNTVFDNRLDPLGAGAGTVTGDVDAVASNDNTFINNIIVANPAINNANNAAIVDRSASTYHNGTFNLGNTWLNNITFNGNVGESSVYLANTATVIDPNVNFLGVDPQFVNSALGNFALRASSPAIRAATIAYGMPVDDLTGSTRSAKSPDIGAYAYDTVSPGSHLRLLGHLRLRGKLRLH